jgi:hypothetical protein
MSKQHVCDAIMTVCGRAPVPLGPGSKEPREVLAAAYEYVHGIAPDSSLSKTDLLEGCLRSVGQTSQPEHSSAGNTITEEGLTAVLYAVQHKAGQAVVSGIITTGATPLLAQQQQWIANSQATADPFKEFIDNAYTAFHARPPQRRGVATHTHPTATITIDYNSLEIHVLDDSGGMNEAEFTSALQAGSTSGPNISGMSGFGVGLKQAATWFVGTNGTWAIETSLPGSPTVETRILLPALAGAVAASYQTGQRSRASSDPHPVVGFTRIILKFSDLTSLEQKVYSATKADGTAPSIQDKNIFAPAICLDLEYTYARFLDGARVLRTANGTPRMETPATRLAIDWVEVAAGTRATTKRRLQTPPDPSDNLNAPAHQRVAVIPPTHAAAHSIAHCYHTGTGSGTTHYWWTAVDIQIQSSNWTHIPPISANVRVAEDHTLTHSPAGSKMTPAERAVHNKYSRGTRLYYNDRLICVETAPWLVGGQPGSTIAKSILAEIDIQNVDHALYQHARSGKGNVNRLLASNKAGVNLAGTPLTLMSDVETQLKERLRKCVLRATNATPAHTVSKQIDMLTFAGNSLHKRIALYPAIPSQMVAPPVVVPPVVVPPVASPPTVSGTPPVWRHTGTTTNGDTYVVTAQRQAGGYEFHCVYTQQQVQHTYTSPVLRGTSEDAAFAKLSLALLIATTTHGSVAGIHVNNMSALQKVDNFAAGLK